MGEEEDLRKKKMNKDNMKKEMQEGMEMDKADKEEEDNKRKRKKEEGEDIGDEERLNDSRNKEEDGSRPVRARGEKRLAENDEIYENKQ